MQTLIEGMEELESQHVVQLQIDGHNNRGALLMDKGGALQNKKAAQPDEGNCSLLGPATNSYSDGLYDKPLPCFGCGIGWFFFIMGFAFPLLWYIATILYLGKYYLRDPRERAGLAASAIAALICSVAALITLFVVFL